jgi:hypothetical protein
MDIIQTSPLTLNSRTRPPTKIVPACKVATANTDDMEAKTKALLVQQQASLAAHERTANADVLATLVSELSKFKRQQEREQRLALATSARKSSEANDAAERRIKEEARDARRHAAIETHRSTQDEAAAAAFASTLNEQRTITTSRAAENAATAAKTLATAQRVATKRSVLKAAAADALQAKKAKQARKHRRHAELFAAAQLEREAEASKLRVKRHQRTLKARLAAVDERYEAAAAAAQRAAATSDIKDAVAVANEATTAVTEQRHLKTAKRRAAVDSRIDTAAAERAAAIEAKQTAAAARRARLDAAKATQRRSTTKKQRAVDTQRNAARARADNVTMLTKARSQSTTALLTQRRRDAKLSREERLLDAEILRTVHKASQSASYDERRAANAAVRLAANVIDAHTYARCTQQHTHMPSSPFTLFQFACTHNILTCRSYVSPNFSGASASRRARRHSRRRQRSGAQHWRRSDASLLKSPPQMSGVAPLYALSCVVCATRARFATLQERTAVLTCESSAFQPTSKTALPRRSTPPTTPLPQVTTQRRRWR